MQTLIAALLASEPFRRALAKPPYIAALLAMMALTIVTDFAGLYWEVHKSQMEATRML